MVPRISDFVLKFNKEVVCFFCSKDVVINVLNLKLFLCFFIIFIFLLVLFNARWIFKNKVKMEKENMLVGAVKVISFIVIVLMLVLIYYMTR